MFKDTKIISVVVVVQNYDIIFGWLFEFFFVFVKLSVNIDIIIIIIIML